MKFFKWLFKKLFEKKYCQQSIQLKTKTKNFKTMPHYGGSSIQNL
jgi:hypothetical protein